MRAQEGELPPLPRTEGRWCINLGNVGAVSPPLLSFPSLFWVGADLQGTPLGSSPAGLWPWWLATGAAFLRSTRRLCALAGSPQLALLSSALLPACLASQLWPGADSAYPLLLAHSGGVAGVGKGCLRSPCSQCGFFGGDCVCCLGAWTGVSLSPHLRPRPCLENVFGESRS